MNFIDLNAIDVKDKNPVFNNGKAGEVIVKITVSAKKPTDEERMPDWTITFTDKENRQIFEGFYYLDPARFTSEEKFNNFLKYEASRLKHLVHAFYGKAFEFPKYDSPKAMLNGCMQLLIRYNNSTVKIGVTFGTVKRPSRKGFIQLKSTFPFITTNLNEEITFSDRDLMERPTPNDIPDNTSGSSDNDTSGEIVMPWGK